MKLITKSLLTSLLLITFSVSSVNAKPTESIVSSDATVTIVYKCGEPFYIFAYENNFFISEYASLIIESNDAFIDRVLERSIAKGQFISKYLGCV